MNHKQTKYFDGPLVYIATNKINGKIYIGKTKGNLYNRVYQHMNCDQTPFDKSIQKYGISAFEWDIIKKCTTIEEMNNTEQDEIKNHLAQDQKVGYNILPGGYEEMKLFKSQCVVDKKLKIKKVLCHDNGKIYDSLYAFMIETWGSKTGIYRANRDMVAKGSFNGFKLSYVS